MQANQTPVIWTVIIVGVILLVAGFFAYAQIPTNEEIKNAATDAANTAIVNANIPTAEEIAGLVVLPEGDKAKIDKICELTDGCEFYEANRWQMRNLLRALDNGDAEDDFFDAMVDFTGIDEDYLVVQDRNDIELKDYQIRAYSEKDKDDGNWEIKSFIKVRYYDSDEANSFNHQDAEYAYLVVTSVLDEGDYDSLSIEEVSRSFEF